MSTIINDAKSRIQKVRRGDVEVRVLRDGKPVEGASVAIRMKNHAFLFGCHGFYYENFDDEVKPRYTELYTNILNYTTLPFYWRLYEPEQYKYDEPHVGNLLKWAKENGLKTKGHPLVWHYSPPKWLTDDHDVGALVTERIEDIMNKYAHSIDFWDLCNETTSNDLFDTPVAHWVKSYGPMNVMKLIDRIARSKNPFIKMLYNENNALDDENNPREVYYSYLREMRDNDINIYGIGIQSHMHFTRWPWDRAIETLDRTAEFGWPIHFTECTVLSGKSGLPGGKIEWLDTTGEQNKWIETEDDLYDQAEYTRDFYTLVFSHPATEALTWWDFPDRGWLRAPCGLVTDKMERKPVYNELEKLINTEWHTDADLSTGTGGNCKASLFFGNYDITINTGGKKVTVNTDILKDGKTRSVTIELVG